MKTLALVLAAALATAAAMPVAAGEVATRIVSHADLDLSNAAHRDVLDRRLARAVRQVCGVGTARDLQAIGEAAQCARESTARIAPKVVAARSAADRGAG